MSDINPSYASAAAQSAAYAIAEGDLYQAGEKIHIFSPQNAVSSYGGPSQSNRIDIHLPPIPAWIHAGNLYLSAEVQLSLPTFTATSATYQDKANVMICAPGAHALFDSVTLSTPTNGPIEVTQRYPEVAFLYMATRKSAIDWMFGDELSSAMAFPPEASYKTNPLYRVKATFFSQLTSNTSETFNICMPLIIPAMMHASWPLSAPVSGSGSTISLLLKTDKSAFFRNPLVTAKLSNVRMIAFTDAMSPQELMSTTEVALSFRGVSIHDYTAIPGDTSYQLQVSLEQVKYFFITFRPSNYMNNTDHDSYLFTPAYINGKAWTFKIQPKMNGVAINSQYPLTAPRDFMDQWRYVFQNSRLQGLGQALQTTVPIVLDPYGSGVQMKDGQSYSFDLNYSWPFTSSDTDMLSTQNIVVYIFANKLLHINQGVFQVIS